MESANSPTGRFATLKILAPMLAFMALMAPTIINYQPYPIQWDEAYYATRIACMNHAVYGGGVRDIVDCLAGAHKGPIMEVLSLPWGPVGGGEAGIGLAFVSLAVLLWLLAWATYATQIRSGAPAWGLVLAAACICATPFTRAASGSLMTDMLVGWSTALSLAFIPLEYAEPQKALRASLLRGLLWGIALTVGALSKVTFLAFFLPIGLVLLWLRWRRSGLRPLAWALVGAFIAFLPALVIWSLFGRTFLDFAMNSAFGATGAPYRVPGMTLARFVADYFKALGLALVPLAVLLILFVRSLFSQRTGWAWRLVPVGIVLMYLGISSRTGMQEWRYLLPVMLSLPLALTWTPGGQVGRNPGSVAFLISMIVGFYLAVPMVAKPALMPLRHARELMESLTHGAPMEIMFALDGPDYNHEVFQLARHTAYKRFQPVIVDTLAYDEINKRSLAESLDRAARSDYLLFLKPGFTLGPAYTRTRTDEFRKLAETKGKKLDVSSEYDVYQMH